MKAWRGVAAVAIATGLMLSNAARAADLSWMGSSDAEAANKPFVEKVIADFKQKTGIVVEPIGYAWGEMQKNILLRSRSHTLPDLVQLQERWVPTYASFDNIVDLNTVFGKEKLAAEFAPDALALGKVGDRQLGLPLFSGSVEMVANKAVLAKAGVAVPTTIDEFKKALIAIRDKVPNSVPYPMATKNNGSILLDFTMWNWAFGGHIVDDKGKVVIDTPESRAALQFMVDLVKERLAAPDIDRPDSRRLTAQGESGFYIDAPVTRTFLRDFSGQGAAFDANVLPMPMPVLKAGDKPVSMQWGHVLALFAPGGKAKPDAPVVKFLDYIASNDVQSTFPISLSALPTTNSGRVAAASDPYFKNWAAATGDALVNEVGVWPNAAQLTDIIGEEVQAAMLGQKSVDDAVKAMQQRMSDSMQ